MGWRPPCSARGENDVLRRALKHTARNPRTLEYVTTSEVLLALLCGAALGLLGTVPLLFVLRRAVKASHGEGKAPSIPVGFAAIVQSGLIVTLGIWLFYQVLPRSYVAASVTAVLVMLAATLACGITAWHALETTRRN